MTDSHSLIMARVREGNKKEELVKAAKYLFMTEGINQVSISKIVNKAGVAQGTFYLYFDSKDEILDAVAENISQDILRNVQHIAEDDVLNAFEKLGNIKKMFFDFLLSTDEVILHFHGEEHAKAHDRLAEAINRQLLPVFKDIVWQGNQEGIFNTDYPDEAAEFVLAISGASHSLNIEDKKAVKRWVSAADDFLIKGLGVKELDTRH